MSRKFGPKTIDAPPEYPPCPGCRKPFKAGDFTALIMVGPGDDEESRKEMESGRPYNAVAMEVHWDCADQSYKDEE